jgi:hypothetical protein
MEQSFVDLAPCHNLQSIGLVQKIMAMYETGCEEGFLNTPS